MTPEERRRVQDVVAERMRELGLTVPQLAAKAGVDPTTVRGLTTGTRWLRDDTRERIVQALEWPPGEISRRVWASRVALEDVPTCELVHELCRRLGRHEMPVPGTPPPISAAS